MDSEREGANVQGASECESDWVRKTGMQMLNENLFSLQENSLFSLGLDRLVEDSADEPVSRDES